MLLMASLLLIGGSWSQQSCPANFSSAETTLGAISNSASLTVCVRNSVMVRGSNGSLKLVLKSTTSTAPKCLIYPNGLSPDLTLSLLQSGHTGCWSLYPPSQPVAIVNVGKPSAPKINSALNNFRPKVPKIFVSPGNRVLENTNLQFGSSASTQVIKTSLLGLNAQVRFTPVAYNWNIELFKSKQARPRFLAQEAGFISASLTVHYGVEYVFPGLTNWQRVYPNILSNAQPIDVTVLGSLTPNPTPQSPRLVLEPCLTSSRWGC